MFVMVAVRLAVGVRLGVRVIVGDAVGVLGNWKVIVMVSDQTPA